MGKLYVGQTKLRIQLTVNQNVAGGTCLIKYKKPSGLTGTWSASILTAASGIIYYDVVSENDLNEAGEWKLWAYVTFSDLKVAAGEPASMMIYEQGK